MKLGLTMTSSRCVWLPGLARLHGRMDSALAKIFDLRRSAVVQSLLSSQAVCLLACCTRYLTHRWTCISRRAAHTADACVQGASELAEALGQLDIGSPAAAATWENGRPILRGMPQMATRPRHTRFTDEGTAVDSPGTGVMTLRGVPAPQGTHIRFDDSEE